MPTDPQCTYYLYHQDTPVRPQDALWQTPLPQNRGAWTDSPAAKVVGLVSHGMYFEAVHTFLSANDFEHVLTAAAAIIEKPLNVNDINKIDIILEKHGEYYHPSRIEVGIQSQRLVLVLNVALSSKGRACLQREYGNLQNLNAAYEWPFLPQVYATGDVQLKDLGQASMFLGQWFEGFHEFHLTRDPNSGQQKTIVWDPIKGSYYLSTAQVAAIYEQAASILTAYFNLQTFEHIFAWHHAAGDFIVNFKQGTPQVKLITVRQYAPLFEPVEHDAEALMQALLLFLLNLSIRMRLDRLDGVGDVAWAPDVAVPATVQGFFRGLALQLTALEVPQEAAQHFRNYLKMHSKDDILDGLTAVVARYDAAMPGLSVVKAYLPLHAASLKGVWERF